MSDHKRISSIAGKLNGILIRTKLWLYIRMDIFILFVVAAVYCCVIETERFGTIYWLAKRSIEVGTDWNNMKYIVDGGSSYGSYQIQIYWPLMYLLIFIGIMFAFQVLDMIAKNYKEYRAIQKSLAPIDEIALKAEELSKNVFSEEKYQLIEEAIDQIEPNDEELLCLGDEDLSGIEASMNNLLKRVRESYRQQSRFVNDASHELRTPIAVIEGYVNMLSRWGKEDEAVLDESIEAIQKESAHMKYLVEQLLFLARGDAGRTKLELEQISLNGLMQDIYEESVMIDEGHIYSFAPSESDIMITADRKLLKQAVRILVDNAAKYTNLKDEIKLADGIGKDGRPYLQVQDTGIGMSEKDAKHMFERFYRADASRSFEGTGLGLSIAKWIVDKHSGHFEVVSRTELGTRIRIVLS